jgi:hypothetical protein
MQQLNGSGSEYSCIHRIHNPNLHRLNEAPSPCCAHYALCAGAQSILFERDILDTSYLLCTLKEPVMNLHLTLEPLVSLLAGVLILFMPKLLNYIVAGYLIILGILGLVR